MTLTEFERIPALAASLRERSPTIPAVVWSSDALTHLFSATYIGTEGPRTLTLTSTCISVACMPVRRNISYSQTLCFVSIVGRFLVPSLDPTLEIGQDLSLSFLSGRLCYMWGLGSAHLFPLPTFLADYCGSDRFGRVLCRYASATSQPSEAWNHANLPCLPEL